MNSARVFSTPPVATSTRKTCRIERSGSGAWCDADAAHASRFLCDEMLAGLARWLRIAGYDTTVADAGSADRRILEQAIIDRRTMLTRDRHLMQMRGSSGRVLVLSGNGIEACARELSDRLRLDWYFDPFSRCPLCNLRLKRAEDGDRARLPQPLRLRAGLVNICPSCRRLYWEGGHVERMRQRLAQFSRP